MNEKQELQHTENEVRMETYRPVAMASPAKRVCFSTWQIKIQALRTIRNGGTPRAHEFQKEPVMHRGGEFDQQKIYDAINDRGTAT